MVFCWRQENRKLSLQVINVSAKSGSGCSRRLSLVLDRFSVPIGAGEIKVPSLRVGSKTDNYWYALVESADEVYSIYGVGEWTA